MANSYRIVERYTEDEAERGIVRRFTDELEGDNELERATKDAQQRHDEEEKTAFEARMRGYFDETSEASPHSDFSASEIARNELQVMCEAISEEEKTSTLARISSRFGKQKKSAKESANALIADSKYQDFKELEKLVHEQGSQWEENHGVVHRNFTRLCKTLDAHKKVFEIFPSQNVYAQVFCRSLALIVEASVNNDEIAEMLSHSVTQIAENASRCNYLVELIHTRRMREQLSKVYEQVFRFYRDALEWFLKSKTSRFFASFNENIKANFEDAAKNIHETMDRMHRDLHISTAAMIRLLQQDTADLKEQVFRQRQAPRSTYLEAGELMQQLLKLMAHIETIRNSEAVKDSIFSIKAPAQSCVLRIGSLTREEARKAAKHLQEYIIGDEGYTLIGNDGQFWMPKGTVIPRLHDWLSNKDTSNSRTLWISSPVKLHKTTSAKAAAMSAVIAAWQAKAPMISHFCEKLRGSGEQQTPEEAGMTGLVYSLILQLLQFKVEGENFDMNAETFHRLDGTNEKLAESLEVLKTLLASTPLVAYCVIYGMNSLEWGNGAKWCRSLLDVLLQHQKNRDGSFNVLLATSGLSKVLPEYVANEDHFFTDSTAKQILRMT